MSYPCGTIYADVVQGSEEWDRLRCGSVGGSHLGAVTAVGKGSTEATTKANYRAQLVCERLSGCKTKGFSNQYMDRGIEDEGPGRECYEFVTGREVQQIGLVTHPAIPHAHASPDGFVFDDGSIEIKRKIPTLHMAYLFTGKVDSDYIKQAQWGLACSGRLWCDFVSYCPELPTEYQLFIKRLDRDDAMIKELEEAVLEFGRSVSKMILDLKALRP